MAEWWLAGSCDWEEGKQRAGHGDSNERVVLTVEIPRGIKRLRGL